MTMKRPSRKRNPRESPSGTPVSRRKRPSPKKPAAKAVRKPAPRPRRGPASSRGQHPSLPASRTPVSRITPEQQIVGAVFLGKVVNFYSHLKVAILVLEAPLAVGDTIRVKGHTTDLTQRIDSLQVAHQGVQSASAGEGVGLKLADKVRAGDAVFKV